MRWFVSLAELSCLKYRNTGIAILWSVLEALLVLEHEEKFASKMVNWLTGNAVVCDEF